MNSWNRSSTTRLARKFFGPFAYAKMVDGSVEIGINRHGAAVGIAWGPDWRTAVESFAVTALRNAQQARGQQEGAKAEPSEETKADGSAEPPRQDGEPDDKSGDGDDQRVEGEGQESKAE